MTARPIPTVQIRLVSRCFLLSLWLVIFMMMASGHRAGAVAAMLTLTAWEASAVLGWRQAASHAHAKGVPSPVILIGQSALDSLSPITSFGVVACGLWFGATVFAAAGVWFLGGIACMAAAAQAVRHIWPDLTHLRAASKIRPAGVVILICGGVWWASALFLLTTHGPTDSAVLAGFLVSLVACSALTWAIAPKRDKK